MSNLTIDINNNCNLECNFCYQEEGNFILTEENIFKAIDESPDVNLIEIGGGEPFLDSRIINIIKEIRERNKDVHISTNGTSIPKKFLNLEDNVKRGIQIQVSLHASNSKLYEQVTGKNFFNKVIENIELLKNYFPVNISSTIYQNNLEDVPRIVNLSKRLELPLRVNLAFPVGNGENINRLDHKQIDQLRGYLFKENILSMGNINSPLVHENNCLALEQFYEIKKTGECPSDSGKIYIAPNGKKSGCEFYRKNKSLVETIKNGT